MSGERYIVHVDMDAFFAAVEQRENPSLQGKPVIVGADPKGGKGRGVVAACSYEARRYGIHSALPISIAYGKCPHCIYLTPHRNKYETESRRIFQILKRFTPDVEPISIDEAFMDITASYKLFGTPKKTCLKIKETIKMETKLTASVGMAPNKMTAKIASDLEKPDGLVIVNQENLLDFLHPLPVEKLWGVGKKTKQMLRDFGIVTIGDLAHQNKEGFFRRFGKAGEHVWKLANGIDERDVEIQRDVKSVGHEYTFDEDEKNQQVIIDTLMDLCEMVSRRMRKSGLRGKTVHLKLRFSDFKTFTRAVTVKTPTNYVEDIYRHSADKLKEFDLKSKAVRLIGVQVTNLQDSMEQYSLFETGPEREEKREKLHRAVDLIKDKFGERAIKHRHIKRG